MATSARRHPSTWRVLGSPVKRLDGVALATGRFEFVHHVRIVFRMGPGCYGVNGADTVSYDAALLSQAVGRPVRVQLSRADEMAWENQGFAFVRDQRVGVDRDGTIVAWDSESWSPTLGGRPGTASPGNVVTGILAGFRPQAIATSAAATAPQGSFSNGSNAVPPYVTGRVGASEGGTGVVKSERVLSHTVLRPFSQAHCDRRAAFSIHSRTRASSTKWRRSYRSLSLGDEVPVIETVLINRTEGEAMGAGETTVTVTAAAIGNATFDATGVRLRQIPFTPDRVRAALASA